MIYTRAISKFGQIISNFYRVRCVSLVMRKYLAPKFFQLKSFHAQTPFLITVHVADSVLHYVVNVAMLPDQHQFVIYSAYDLWPYQRCCYFPLLLVFWSFFYFTIFIISFCAIFTVASKITKL